MSLLQKLKDRDAIPSTFDHCWEDTIDKMDVEVFTCITDDTETMGGIGVETFHAIGIDKQDKIVYLACERYEDGETTDWSHEDFYI